MQVQLEQGCPSTYGRILKYLAFESSNAFINYLTAKNVNMEIRHMIESKFIKELTKVLVDLFKYRVALSPEQFIQNGFTERKMVLVLDLYDIIKQVRMMAKVGHRLTMKDTAWEHPCDQALKLYSLVDHQNRVSKQMQFNMNAALLKSNVTCKESKNTTEDGKTDAESPNGQKNVPTSPKKRDKIDIYHLERSQMSQNSDT